MNVYISSFFLTCNVLWITPVVYTTLGFSRFTSTPRLHDLRGRGMSYMRQIFSMYGRPYSHKAINDLNAIKDPLFCSLVVDNLVAPFLCSNGVDIILQGSSDPSLGSKERRGSHGRVPGLSLIVKHNEYTAMPFLCEVKPPSHMQGLNHKDVQKPDFIKLANIMKDELDHMDMIEDKRVYGLLVEGFKCQLFVMDLCYYKLYRFYMIDQFYLPRAS